MILIHCPYCEQTLPELEFAYAGEAHIARPVDPSALSDEGLPLAAAAIPALSDEECENYLFIRANPRGRHHERWRHVHGCGRFFNAVRDTVTDKFETTYKAGEPRK
mgnify:CR=1 FL=1